MSLGKSKFWYLNNCLHILKSAKLGEGMWAIEQRALDTNEEKQLS